MNEPIMLRADQADDLRRLLGTVEDWLLHTCFEVRDGCRPRPAASLDW